MLSATRYRATMADLAGSGGSGGSATPTCGWQVAGPRVVQMLAPVSLAVDPVDLHVDRCDAIWFEQPGQVAGVHRPAVVVTPRGLVDLVQLVQDGLAVHGVGVAERVAEVGEQPAAERGVVVLLRGQHN